MFAELIFVVLAIFGLLLIDNFSTSCALITCVLAVYYYVDYFPFVLNKYAIVFVATKIWGTICYFYRFGKQIYSLFQRIIFSGKISVPPPSVYNQFCGDEPGVENEINILVSKVSQYYIHSWYDKISSNEQFVSYLNSSINDTLVSLCTSISKVDKKKFSYAILQIYLNFLSHFVEAKNKSEVFKRENFKMKHWAMKDKVTEWCYLQSLVSALLDSFCPSECERSLHSKYSPILHSVVVEILTENLIHPLLNVLCNPTRLNLMILKVLINYNNTNDRTNSSVCKLPRKDTTAPTEHCKTTPTILLPNEVLPNNHSSTNSTKMKSQKFLSVPDSSAVNQIQKNTSQFSVGKSSEMMITDNIPLYFSSGIKSSSNINISDYTFHSDSGALDCDSYPSYACDTTIKRSRSADYIRQINPVCANTQLKALNEKEYNIILQSENNRMFVALKLDSNSGNDIEEAEEAMEFEGQTLFSDIKITDTYLQNEAGLIPFTLYFIQYTGVFHDTENSTDTPRLVKKVINIKRRFKEFVELHSKLEDNPALKIYLKGIRGPNKWLILPFSNLDKKNIADRKIFLENYLKELCSSIFIAQSPELHQFLAYGDEERIYARKSTDATVPRIDKILVRGVKSAFDMFKTTVPLEEDNVFSSETVSEDAIPFLRCQEHLLDFCSREPEIDEHVRNFMQNSSFQLFSEDSKITESDVKNASLRSNHYLKNAGCCRCPALPGNKFYEEKYPLANSIFELIAVSFKLNETTPGDMSSVVKLACFTIVRLLCAANIDRICASKLDDISEEHLTSCFHLLHKYLWPDEKCSNQTKESLEDEGNLNKVMEYLEAILSSQSLMQNINFAVKRMLLEKINLFLSSIQHQETNRCLLYHVFDVIIETLCSNEM